MVSVRLNWREFLKEAFRSSSGVPTKTIIGNFWLNSSLVFKAAFSSTDR